MIVTYIRKPKPLSADLRKFLKLTPIVRNKFYKLMPIGCLIAFKEGNQVFVGHSLCMKNDQFKKKTAVAIAKSNVGKPVPRSLRKYVPDFLDRCQRYFKCEVTAIYVDEPKEKSNVG